MEDASVSLLVRQTFMDRKTEVPAKLSIERIGTTDKPGPLDPLVLAQSLQRVTAFVENTAKLFADWAESYQPPPAKARRKPLGSAPTSAPASAAGTASARRRIRDAG